MRTRTRIAALCSVLALTATHLSACGENTASDAAVSIQDAANKIEDEIVSEDAGFDGESSSRTRTVNAGGLERQFIETIPDEVDSLTDLPLIFVFHGYKNNAEQLRRFTQFDNANAVVVYMDGIGDAWAPAPYARTTGEQDLAFFDKVRDTMLEEYPVNPSRIFLAGLSNGGGFAAYTACNRAHQVTGIATVSAAFYEKVFEDCSPIPVKQIDFHGTGDETMRYDGGDRHGEAYLPVMDVMENAARRNYCEPDPFVKQIDRLGHEIDRPGEEYSWENCDAQLRHYRLDGGKHIWPGSKDDKGPADEPADGYASKEILEFFGVNYRGPMGPADPEGEEESS